MTADYPFHVDGRGRTATTDSADHIRDLIEQVLFTTPGERVMRPTFGSGLLGLTFEPASVEVAATTQLVVQSALTQHLSDLITVNDVHVVAGDPDAPAGPASISITVTWTALSTGDNRSATFPVPGGGV